MTNQTGGETKWPALSRALETTTESKSVDRDRTRVGSSFSYCGGAHARRGRGAGKNAVAGAATSGRERNACTLDKPSEESPKESKAKKNKQTVGRARSAQNAAPVEVG